MAKTLIYRRTEFVRDYYELEWTEDDYQNLLNYLSKETDVNSKTRYEILKDLSLQFIAPSYYSQFIKLLFECCFPFFF